MSSRNSGIWLAAQGVLALLRLAVWITDPAVDDHIMLGTKGEGSIPSLSEKQLGLIYISRNSEKEFHMPKWTAESLCVTTFCLHESFTTALSAYVGRQNSGMRLLELLQNALETWDMPEELFMSWVNAHHRTSQPLLESQQSGKELGARIIMDREGRHHVLPFWSCTDFHGDHKIKMFGNFSDENETVIHKSSYYESRDTPREDQMIIGWPDLFRPDESPSLVRAQSTLQRFEELHDDYSDDDFAPLPRSTIRTLALKKVDLMWRSLREILKVAASQHDEPLPELFFDEAEAKNPEYSEAPAET